MTPTPAPRSIGEVRRLLTDIAEQRLMPLTRENLTQSVADALANELSRVRYAAICALAILGPGNGSSYGAERNPRSGELLPAKFRLEIEKGREGLFYVTSPDNRGLLVAGPTFAEALAAVTGALVDLAIASYEAKQNSLHSPTPDDGHRRPDNTPEQGTQRGGEEDGWWLYEPTFEGGFLVLEGAGVRRAHCLHEHIARRIARLPALEREVDRLREALKEVNKIAMRRSRRVSLVRRGRGFRAYGAKRN